MMSWRRKDLSIRWLRRGCYVAAMNLELVKEQNLQKMEEHLREVVRLAEISGVEKVDVEEMLQLVYEENP